MRTRSRGGVVSLVSALDSSKINERSQNPFCPQREKSQPEAFALLENALLIGFLF